MKPTTPTVAEPPVSPHSALELPAAEPWSHPVSGENLLDELTQTLRRFVVLPQSAAETLALWIVHTYAFPLRGVSTYLGIESPEKRCGKTTLLSLLSELVNRPVVAANISPSALFRVIEETRPTLLIDEADTLLRRNDEFRGILNSGYTLKTAYVVRVAGRGRATEFSASPSLSPPLSAVGSAKAEALAKADTGREPERESPDQNPALNPGAVERGTTSGTFSPPAGRRLGRAAHSLAGSWGGVPAAQHPSTTRLARYSCWCPKVMAAIGQLPDTLADRCIVIRMQRKTAREECERLRHLEPETLRQKCARFVADHTDQISAARPDIPAALNDRAADVWEPLLVLADLAGGAWPEKARTAAVALTNASQDGSPAAALLLDIFVAFKLSAADRLHSRVLVETLNSFGPRPWRQVKGEINETWLARHLRPYAIKTKTIWIGETSAKGYLMEDFKEVFTRYITPTDLDSLRPIGHPPPPQPEPVPPSTQSGSGVPPLSPAPPLETTPPPTSEPPPPPAPDKPKWTWRDLG